MKKTLVALTALLFLLCCSALADESVTMELNRVSEPVVLINEDGFEFSLISVKTGSFYGKDMQLVFRAVLDEKYVVPSMDGYDAIVKPLNLKVGDTEIDIRQYQYEMGLDAYMGTPVDGKYTDYAYLNIDNPDLEPVSFTLQATQGVKATRGQTKRDSVIVNMPKYEYTGTPVTITLSNDYTPVSAGKAELGSMNARGPAVPLFSCQGISVSAISKEKGISWFSGMEQLMIGIEIKNDTDEPLVLVPQSASQGEEVYELNDGNYSAIVVDPHASTTSGLTINCSPYSSDYAPLRDESELNELNFLFDIKKGDNSYLGYRYAQDLFSVAVEVNLAAQ